MRRSALENNNYDMVSRYSFLDLWPCSLKIWITFPGTTKLHVEIEELGAHFVGKEAAILFGMGYVTNLALIPCLIGKGGLIISDSLNHNSIVNGARGSGATVRVFQHNTPSHLGEVLREQIAEGQPRTHRPWKKIIVIVEGIYSMEGELCKLPEIIVVCKKYIRHIHTWMRHTTLVQWVNREGEYVNYWAWTLLMWTS